MMPRVISRSVLAILLPIFIQLSSCATAQNEVKHTAPPKQQVLLRLVGFGPAFPVDPETLPEPTVETASKESSSPIHPESVYELCFDPQVTSGKLPHVAPVLTSVRIASGPPGSAAAVESALRSWTWTLYGSRPISQIQPASLCFHERLPFADAALPKAVPDATIKEHKPFDERKDYDSLPVNKFVEHARYQLAMLPSMLELRRKTQQPPNPDPANAPKITIKKSPLYTPSPHLPRQVKALYDRDLVIGVFKVCLGTNGRVSSITPIIPIPGASRDVMQTLASWRFEPLSVAICFAQTLEFRVGW